MQKTYIPCTIWRFFNGIVIEFDALQIYKTVRLFVYGKGFVYRLPCVWVCFFGGTITSRPHSLFMPVCAHTKLLSKCNLYPSLLNRSSRPPSKTILCEVLKVSCPVVRMPLFVSKYLVLKEKQEGSSPNDGLSQKPFPVKAILQWYFVMPHASAVDQAVFRLK